VEELQLVAAKQL